jgi:hypothetical protein
MKFCLVDFRNARPKLGASNKKREQIMRSGFRVAAALGSLLVLGGASDMRPPGTTVYGNAPIGDAFRATVAGAASSARRPPGHRLSPPAS